ncbi:hypothetical protein PV10_07353 [Exophiala mesophila]|uniref:Beta-glucuronidase C-terminal domain-containing protein n=1 Tax=Exophiala mesophila TaxID=212818 RepID=A0A0D1ZTC0_EXOME|nr:uncharacterized protein PV10_07353 [Exophiala mesophila]KIV90003.1 hypothetical protein PV10_07353 [Exophiala mesophila]
MLTTIWTVTSILLIRAAQCATIVPLTAPSYASQPLLDSFVSFSIEFSSFPDFAGNSTHPNTFSYNLLQNLWDLQGTPPIIRVGGNTQDYYTFDATQQEALVGSVDPSRSPDYPTTISIGPSYFDSYTTWPGFSYVHGLNLGKNGTVGYDTLVATVPLVCQHLAATNRLAYWQLGNEPDLFETSTQGPVRPSWWAEPQYVEEYLNKTRIIRGLVQEHCPEVIEQDRLKYQAPSFAGTANNLDLVTTWNEGIDADSEIALIDSHNYINGATAPGVTLQGTLMNHTSTVISVDKHIDEIRQPAIADSGLPYILGETNSLYNQGAPGLSDSFGAALWGVDFNLYCAASGIRRVHMHQGTNYRYASWQPIDTNLATTATKAPYYGNIAVATFLGNTSASDNVRISELDLDSEPYHSAYAAYINDRLERIALVQMQAYNSTDGGQGGDRPSETFTLQLDGDFSTVQEIEILRLTASGSNAVTDVSFDGYSYSHDLDDGRPSLLPDVPRGEVVQVTSGGEVVVDLPWSSAAVLILKRSS